MDEVLLLTPEMQLPRLNRQQLAVLREMSDGELVHSRKKLAKYAGLTQGFTKVIVEGFTALGWTESGPLFSEDDGLLRGRGTWLNREGCRVREMFRQEGLLNG